MGEAKRRGQQARQAGDALRARIAAGAFGAERPVTGWLFVIDRSPLGMDLLRVLGTMSEFEGLRSMLAGEAVRLWEASPLFPYLVLRGGAGTPAQRVALAASLERLCSQALPGALSRLGTQTWGAELALAPEARRAVQATLARLRG
jgi:hypothetical protein